MKEVLELNFVEEAEWRRKELELNFVEEERVDVEVMVEGEENREVSYDEVRHDQKAQKLWQHSFQKQDLCEISEMHEIKRLHTVRKKYGPYQEYQKLSWPN